MNAVLRACRAVLRIPEPLVGRERARELAIAEYERRGGRVAQGDRLAPKERLRTWEVVFNRGQRPNQTVVIDNQTGEVRAFHSLPY